MKSTGFKASQNQVIIESVISLDESQQQSILTSLKLDPKTHSVINRRNSSLIAGLRIMYAGKIIDLSFQSLLNQLSSES